MSIPEQVDVAVVGGALMGASVAFHLLRADPALRVAVIEPDPSFADTSTARTNSCIRQQFGTELNVRISQHGIAFIKGFADELGEADAPPVLLDPFGYLYLAADEGFAGVLREACALQTALGAGTRMMSAAEIAAEWPFIETADIVAGSHGTADEGYFDGGTLFYGMRAAATRRGAIQVRDRVTGIDTEGGRVTAVRLEGGARISCGWVVNCAGSRAAEVAAMAGLAVPIEPRKRFTFVFSCPDDLGKALPLTIDPSGVHVRQDGANFLAGCPPDDDGPVDAADLAMDHEIWEAKVWPAIAARVPAFERARVISEWAGHYAYNTLDQNAVVGPDEALPNFVWCNGFSGHGFQQSPAMGRGVSECIVHGGYRTLDLSPLGPGRIARGAPYLERAVI